MMRKGLFEQRRNDIDRINDMTVKVTRYQGRVQILGSGDSTIDIPFPVKFSERPTVYCGLEFDEASWPTTGDYPTWGATVSSWQREGEIEGAFAGYYIGATVVIRIIAPAANFWLHYTFDGKALRNPISGMDSTSDAI